MRRSWPSIGSMNETVLFGSIGISVLASFAENPFRSLSYIANYVMYTDVERGWGCPKQLPGVLTEKKCLKATIRHSHGSDLFLIRVATHQNF